MAIVTSPNGAYMFPPELIRHVVDEIDVQTRHTPSLRVDTLRSLSRVSQAFCSPAQTRLLSEISFPRFSGHKSVVEKRTATFCELLDRNKTWSQHIRNLSFSFDDRLTTAENHSAIFAGGDVSSPAYHYDPEIGTYLETFLNTALDSGKLEEVSLEAHTITRRTNQISWNLLKRYGISAMSTMIQASNSLQTLKLVNLGDFPLSLFLGCFASNYWHELVLINSLPDLPYVAPGNYGEQKAQASQTASKIETLTLWHVPYVTLFVTLRLYLPTQLDNKSSWLYFSKLRTLRMTMPLDRFELDVIWKFISGVSGTLENLELRGDLRKRMAEVSEPQVFRLDQLPNLRRIKFSADLGSQPLARHFTKVDAAGTLQVIVAILHWGSTTSKVTTIAIELNTEEEASSVTLPVLSIDECWKKMNMHYFDLNWHELDKILDNLYFPELQNVSVMLSMYYRDHRTDNTTFKGEMFDPASILPLACVRPATNIFHGVNLIRSSLRMAAQLDDYLLFSN